MRCAVDRYDVVLEESYAAAAELGLSDEQRAVVVMRASVACHTLSDEAAIRAETWRIAREVQP